MPPFSVPLGVDKLCIGVSEAKYEQMTGLVLDCVGQPCPMCLWNLLMGLKMERTWFRMAKSAVFARICLQQLCTAAHWGFFVFLVCICTKRVILKLLLVVN